MEKLKPGTIGRHFLHGNVTVLDPESAEVIRFKASGINRSHDWTYIRIEKTGRIEGVLDHTIEDFDRRIARLERELAEARREKDEASWPKAGETFLSIKGNFTATVKLVESPWVFYTFSGNYDGATAQKVIDFQRGYPKKVTK